MYMSPTWFQGFDILIEILFVIVAIIMGFYASKIYKKTRDRRVVFFSAGFFLLALSYILYSFSNACMVMSLGRHVGTTDHLLFTIGFYVHILFKIAALALFVATLFKERAYIVFGTISAVSLIGIFSSIAPNRTLYFISMVLLFVLANHFITTYIKNKNKKTLLIGVAFMLMIVSRLAFVAAMQLNVYYVIGHFTELIAFGFILANYVLVYRDGKKAASYRNYSRHSSNSKK